MTSPVRHRQDTVRSPDEAPGGKELRVTSATFEAGGSIPRRVALSGCGGENVSPQLAWTGAPAETRSFALTCFDPDAPTGCGFWHWVVADIPASVTSLEEGAATKGLPRGTVQGMTDYGTAAWGGPCPPPGDAPHRYIFTVYALDIPSIQGASPSMSGARLVFSMRGHLLAKGHVEGRFGR